METTVEELVVLDLVEDVDELVVLIVELVVLMVELVVLVTELVDLDLVTDAEVAAPHS
jgi:hypothetical protein